MLRGKIVGLRAVQDSDIEVFEAELLNDAETKMRSDSRPWRPVSPGAAQSQYREASDPASTVPFAVVELATSGLVGEALLWGIDLHNRNAHLGLSLRPAFRGQGMGADIVRVLCRYGFAVRGLHRLQIETLTDNAAMIGAATKAAFVPEGTLRAEAWVDGHFADTAIFGLLAEEWLPTES
jgi:RimJ/RimL family protein N-acetyltransferase